ncbi:cytochrome P450 4V2-like, partial [Achroia grisella]|uniref:cytochrome P450 4V2-like n=1 Tax=Achroia grisella TaxID=688607 RepID=UPI0027D2F7F6
MFVFTCLIVCVTLIWVWRNRKFIKLHRQIGVQYPALPLIGHAYMFVGDGQVVVDAEAAELVLANCLEKDEFNLFFRKLLGSGSIMAPVSVWRPRRKQMAPFFGITNANRFQDSLLKHSDNLVKHLESMADTEPFSMFDVFYPYAFDTIMELILGLTLNSHEEEDTRVLKAVPDCFNSVAYFLFQPYLQFEIIYTRLPIWAKFLNDKQNIQRLIAKVMASKQKLYDGKNNNVDANISLKSLVDFLYSSPDDKKLSIDEIREELFVMLFGSTILPCVSLCFTCMMLAKYPDVQEKLIRELDEESSRYEKGLTKSRPHENKYLEAVIKETFRLYPSVPTVSRKIDKDIEM